MNTITKRALETGQRVVRTLTSYQFTSAHATRAILEYNTRSQRAAVSLLYTFSPRPHTAVFAGYGDQFLHGIDPANGSARPGLQREHRTVFLKLSHSFRR